MKKILLTLSILFIGITSFSQETYNMNPYSNSKNYPGEKGRTVETLENGIALMLTDDLTGVGAVDDVFIPTLAAISAGVIIYNSITYDIGDWEIKGVSLDKRLPKSLYKKACSELIALKESVNRNYCVYKLIATESKLYPSYERGMQFLEIGETYKIGKTYIGNTRYKDGWLNSNKVKYIILYEGLSEIEALALEKILIYNYILSKENLKRKYPLIRPPGNKGAY